MIAHDKKHVLYNWASVIANPDWTDEEAQSVYEHLFIAEWVEVHEILEPLGMRWIAYEGRIEQLDGTEPVVSEHAIMRMFQVASQRVFDRIYDIEDAAIASLIESRKLS